MLTIKFNYQTGQSLTLNGTTLNAKQSAISAKLIEGKTAKTIAGELDMKAMTVKYHLNNIFKALNGWGVNSFAVVAKIAQEHHEAISMFRDGEEITSLQELKTKPFTTKKESIFQEMITGSPSNKIASGVSISEATVKYHIGGICKQIGGNRKQVIAAANALNARDALSKTLEQAAHPTIYVHAVLAHPIDPKLLQIKQALIEGIEECRMG